MTDYKRPDNFWNPRRTKNTDTENRDKILFSLIALTRFMRCMIQNVNRRFPLIPACLLPFVETFHEFLTQTIILIFQARFSFLEDGNSILADRKDVIEALDEFYIPQNPKTVRTTGHPPKIGENFMFNLIAFNNLRPGKRFSEISLALSTLLSLAVEFLKAEDCKDQNNSNQASSSSSSPMSRRVIDRACFICESTEHESTQCDFEYIESCTECGDSHPSDAHYPKQYQRTATQLAIIDRILPDNIKTHDDNNRSSSPPPLSEISSDSSFEVVDRANYDGDSVAMLDSASQVRNVPIPTAPPFEAIDPTPNPPPPMFEIPPRPRYLINEPFRSIGPIPFRSRHRFHPYQPITCYICGLANHKWRFCMLNRQKCMICNSAFHETANCFQRRNFHHPY